MRGIRSAGTPASQASIHPQLRKYEWHASALQTRAARGDCASSTSSTGSDYPTSRQSCVEVSYPWSVRERVASWLHASGVLDAFAWVRARLPVPSVAIVTYHHIADDAPTSPYDGSIADATPKQFRRHLELIARHTTPITLDQLLAALAGKPLPKNPVMITFDDGYRSCAETALPILKSMGIPATFFIATSFITDHRLYWWERIAVLLHLATVARATIEYPHHLEFSPFERRIQKRLCDIVKNTPSLDVLRYTSGLARALGVEWSPELEAEYARGLIMSWDQVRELGRAGMAVESHGRRHRVLQTLDDDALDDELAGSRAELEAQLGRPVRAIAYPVGRSVAKDRRIRDALIAAGYRLGFSNKTGVNVVWPGDLSLAPKIDPFAVRRLATDRCMNDAMFLTQIVIPRLAYIDHDH